MPDEVDVANDMAEKMLFAAINAAKGVSLVIEGDGYCLNCGEIVVENYNGVIGRWCNLECCSDYQRRR